MLDKDLDYDNEHEVHPEVEGCCESVNSLINELQGVIEMLLDARDADDLEKAIDELNCQAGTVGTIVDTLNTIL